MLFYYSYEISPPNTRSRNDCTGHFERGTTEKSHPAFYTLYNKHVLFTPMRFLLRILGVEMTVLVIPILRYLIIRLFYHFYCNKYVPCSS